MTDFPPPTPPGFPPPPPSGFPPPPPPPPSAPPGYVAYGEHRPTPGALQFAGFWARFAAVIIDGLILGVPLGILTAMVVDNGTFMIYGGYGYGLQQDTPTWLNVLSTGIGVLYYAWFEGGPTGQTIGKRALGIRVVDANTGQPSIGYGRGVGRYFARILSALPCALGYFWMLWDDRNQTWHDKIVKTFVVKA